MKKVLLISPQPFFQWRGSPIRVRFTALALAEAGLEVDLLTLPVGEECDLPGVNIIRVANPFGVKNIPIGPSTHKLIFDFLILLKGLSLIFRKKYSIIHGVEEAGIIAKLLSSLKRIPSIYEIHSDPLSHGGGTLKNLILRTYSSVEKFTVGLSDAVICTGTGLVKQVEEMGVKTKAFHIFDIPSSLSEATVEQTAEVRDKLLKKEGEVLITFVGSFAGYQGVDLLLDTIPQVVEKNPLARFIIIGGTGAEIQQKQELLTLQGVDSHVDFIGKIPPDILPNYLSASDILLSPRVSGANSPLKLLDYLKTGNAIVATDLESNRVILSTETAVLAPPDPQSFADAIVLLMDDEQARLKMGKKGYSLYENKYNFKEYSRLLAQCYSYVFDNRDKK